MVPSGEGQDGVAREDQSQKGESSDGGIHAKPEFLAGGARGLENVDEKSPPSVVSAKSSQEPDSGARISQLDKEGSIASIAPHDLSQTPGSGSRGSQSDKEGKTMVREKVSDDGYYWRKYGQKLVKGNEFVRSYYRCTNPSCQVKKQLEYSHNGQIADVLYFGEHGHPRPKHVLPQAFSCDFSIVEEKRDARSLTRGEEGQTPHLVKSIATSQKSTVASSEEGKGVLLDSNRKRDGVGNADDPRPKRQKKGKCNLDPPSVEKATSDTRVVVQTVSEVDMVTDGHRWRKYGQKMVKGNPNPRSYYRCSSVGCPAKKHVERASDDPKVVITSYEGQHDHDMPPLRSVTHNAAGVDANNKAEVSTKSEETDDIPKSMDVPTCNSLAPNGKPKEH